MSKVTDKWQFWTAMGVLGLGAGAFVYSKVSKGIQQSRENKAANAIDDVKKKDPREAYASAFAQRLYASFFQAGYTWLPDGTDENEIYRVADAMKKYNVPFSMVAKSYKNLYNRDLKDDLTDELANDEIATFYSRLGININGLAYAQPQISIGNLI